MRYRLRTLLILLAVGPPMLQERFPYGDISRALTQIAGSSAKYLPSSSPFIRRG